jgi:circadian clock protein KaiC
MERVSTNIKELDSALDGGIPKRNTVLVSGGSGTGKTTLALQFAFGAPTIDKQKAIFFTINETEMKLMENYAEFTFFNKSLIESQMLSIVDLRAVVPGGFFRRNTLSPDKTVNFIYDRIVAERPSRIVIDSISGICAQFKDDSEIRQFLFNLANVLLVTNCTAILIMEVSGNTDKFSNYGVEEFVTDGLIQLLRNEQNGNMKKFLRVLKMRGTKHSDDMFKIHIDNEGMHLLNYLGVKE